MWFAVEFFDLKTAITMIGITAVAAIVGIYTDLSNLRRAIEMHAKRLFPDAFDDE